MLCALDKCNQQKSCFEWWWNLMWIFIILSIQKVTNYKVLSPSNINTNCHAGRWWEERKISNAVEERGQDTTPNSHGNNNNKAYSRQYGALISRTWEWKGTFQTPFSL